MTEALFVLAAYALFATARIFQAKIHYMYYMETRRIDRAQQRPNDIHPPAYWLSVFPSFGAVIMAKIGLNWPEMALFGLGLFAAHVGVNRAWQKWVNRGLGKPDVDPNEKSTWGMSLPYKIHNFWSLKPSKVSLLMVRFPFPKVFYGENRGFGAVLGWIVALACAFLIGFL